jgi:hypothetical protein
LLIYISDHRSLAAAAAGCFFFFGASTSADPRNTERKKTAKDFYGFAATVIRERN